MTQQSQLFKTLWEEGEESKLDDYSPYKEVLHSPTKLTQFKKKSVRDKSLQVLVPLMNKGLGEVVEAIEVLTNESHKLMRVLRTDLIRCW